MNLRLWIVLPLLALALPARAVDLSKHTLGVGATTEFAFGSHAGSQLSARAALSPRAIGGLMLGFSASPSVAFAPGVRFDWVLVGEEHMNLTAGGAMSIDLRTSGLRAFRYRLGAGFELFTSDWPNLGFLLDFGFRGALGPDGNDSAEPGITTGVTPFGAAGVHYYF